MQDDRSVTLVRRVRSRCFLCPPSWSIETSHKQVFVFVYLWKIFAFVDNDSKSKDTGGNVFPGINSQHVGFQCIHWHHVGAPVKVVQFANPWQMCLFQLFSLVTSVRHSFDDLSIRFDHIVHALVLVRSSIQFNWKQVFISCFNLCCGCNAFFQ